MVVGDKTTINHSFLVKSRREKGYYGRNHKSEETTCAQKDDYMAIHSPSPKSCSFTLDEAGRSFINLETLLKMWPLLS